jgi:hypothetical protein
VKGAAPTDNRFPLAAQGARADDALRIQRESGICTERHSRCKRSSGSRRVQHLGGKARSLTVIEDDRSHEQARGVARLRRQGAIRCLQRRDAVLGDEVDALQRQRARNGLPTVEPGPARPLLSVSGGAYAIAGLRLVRLGCAKTKRPVCPRSNQPARKLRLPSAVAILPERMESRVAVPSS